MKYWENWLENNLKLTKHYYAQANDKSHTQKPHCSLHTETPMCKTAEFFIQCSSLFKKKKKNVFSRTDIAWNSKYFSSKNNHVLDLCNAFYLGIH